MDYIVLDLEWNQSPRGKAGRKNGLPFEIIEIGAVKLDGNKQIVGEFHEMIKPTVYRQLHFMTKEILQISMKELEKARPFREVIRDFFAWCGEDFRMCTWGSMDLTELQRNIAFFHIKNPMQKPLLYMDIQKMYSLRYDDGKSRMALKDAVEQMEIPEDIPFHRALADTIYTARIMQKMDLEPVKDYLSVDYFHAPETREDEIYLSFADYSKYVSHVFQTKEEMMKDRSVTATPCCSCGRNLRKKVRWFPTNGKTYLCLTECPEHGCMKSKLRVKKAEKGGVFAVKTSKLVGEEGAQLIRDKKTETARHRKDRHLAAKKQK